MKQLRKRLTYANVMSTIAVFLVLGGATAFAANKIGTDEIQGNAIVTGKIKKEAVTEGKIKAGAVGNTRLANGSVSATKLAPGSVTNAAIANGAVNASKIAPGSIGASQLGPNAVGAGQLGTLTLRSAVEPVANGAQGSANIVCNPGERVISGGGAWTAFAKGLSFLSSRPLKSLADLNNPVTGEAITGWRSSGLNESGGANGIQVWVLCLS